MSLSAARRRGRPACPRAGERPSWSSCRRGSRCAVGACCLAGRRSPGSLRGAHDRVVLRQRRRRRAGRRRRPSTVAVRRRAACSRRRGRSAPSRRRTAAPSCRPAAAAPVGVLDVRAARRRSGRARALDLRLGDAELVDALAHDVDRAVDAPRWLTFDCSRRLGLVDELDAALRSRPSFVGFVATITTSDASEQPERRAAGRRCCGGGRSWHATGSSELTSRASGRAAGRRRRRRPGRGRRSRCAGRSPSALTCDGLAERAHAPLQHRADVVVAVGELAGRGPRATGRPMTRSSSRPGELEGAPAAADHAALLVADEERGVGRRVVVVEQLEQEARSRTSRSPRASRGSRRCDRSRSCGCRSWGR